MRVYLPDVSVLVALHDSSHPAHAVTHNWFHNERRTAWATCPLTENGFIRITAQTAMKGRQDAVLSAFLLLEGTKQIFGETHQFWSDSVSLSEADLFVPSKIAGHKQITDVYLLGLSQRNGGVFVTLDTHLTSSAIIAPHAELIRILM